MQEEDEMKHLAVSGPKPSTSDARVSWADLAEAGLLLRNLNYVYYIGETLLFTIYIPIM